MVKVKGVKIFNIFKIIKCCLIGVLTTLLGVVVLAVVLKFADLSTSAIGYINNIIKGAHPDADKQNYS